MAAKKFKEDSKEGSKHFWIEAHFKNDDSLTTRPLQLNLIDGPDSFTMANFLLQ